jgi:multidrug efflux pump
VTARIASPANSVYGPRRQAAVAPDAQPSEGVRIGLAKLAALREAALTRLRPVLMTSAATVFGHLPLVWVTGPGAEARNSIGTVLVTGMVVGTVFTLVVVPVFYMLIAKDRQREVREASLAQPVAVGA